jgi:hypothetical protein
MNKDTRHKVKLEFQINMNKILVEVYPMQYLRSTHIKKVFIIDLKDN